MPTTCKHFTIVRVYGKRERTAAFEFSLFLSTNKVLTRFIICTESFQAQSKCIDSDKFCTRIDRFSAVES